MASKIFLLNESLYTFLALIGLLLRSSSVMASKKATLAEGHITLLAVIAFLLCLGSLL